MQSSIGEGVLPSDGEGLQTSEGEDMYPVGSSGLRIIKKGRLN